MSTAEVIDLSEIIDASLAATIAAHVPPVPSVVADSLSRLLFRDLTPQEYEYFRGQVLTAVHERLAVFLSEGRDFDFSLEKK